MIPLRLRPTFAFWFLLFYYSSSFSAAHLNEDLISQIDSDNFNSHNTDLNGKHLLVIPWSGVNGY
jgi:hypothetical protein